jgi:hypothetical protein
LEEKQKFKGSSTKLPFVNGSSLNGTTNINGFNPTNNGPILFVADKKRIQKGPNPQQI